MEERKTELQELNDKLKMINDDQLEELYRQCLIYGMKRDGIYTNENFNSMKDKFEKVTNSKAGLAIMERYIFGEIARRWRKQRKLLKGFKELFVQI